MTIDNSPTPAWLTAILRQAGVLQHGAVTQVEQQMSPAFNSQLAFLRLSYSADAGPNLPTRVVLKRNVASDWDVEAGAEEVKFYKLLAAAFALYEAVGFRVMHDVLVFRKDYAA